MWWRLYWPFHGMIMMIFRNGVNSSDGRWWDKFGVDGMCRYTIICGLFYYLLINMQKLLFLCGLSFLWYSGIALAQLNTTNFEDIANNVNQAATAFDNSWCRNPIPWVQYHPWQQRCYCTELWKEFIKIMYPWFPFPWWLCWDRACDDDKLWNDELSTCVDPNHNVQNVTTSQSNINLNKGRWQFGSSPLEILDNVTDRANPANDRIQDTALDNVTHSEWSYPFAYRLANTFDSIRRRSAPYLDWMFYIGLSVAVILLIWQWFQLVIGKTFADIRKPITNIVVGVVVLTGVYLMIKLVTSVVALIFNV